LATDEDVASLWRPIIEKLDQCGLIIGVQGSRPADTLMRPITHALDTASISLLAEAKRNETILSTIRSAAPILRRAARVYLETGPWSEYTDSYRCMSDNVVTNPFAERDFYILTLRLQVAAWLLNAPASIFACCELLDRTLRAVEPTGALRFEESTSATLLERL